MLHYFQMFLNILKMWNKHLMLLENKMRKTETSLNFRRALNNW